MNGFEKKRRQTLERALAEITKKGGSCADPTLLASGDKITVRCANGHEWSVSPYKLIDGDWCFDCARETAARQKREETFKKLQAYVDKTGGRVDAASYDFGGQFLSVVCWQGHRTLVDPVDTLYWSKRCPDCLASERAAKLVAKQAGRVAAAKLKEQARREKIRVAVEAQDGTVLPGQQGADRNHTWVRCGKHGIASLVRNDRIVSGQWCSPCGTDKRATDRRHKTLEEAKIYAAAKGGRVVSESYPIGANTVEWECAHGHRWRASPSTVMNGGTWCAEEADRSPKTMTATERQSRAAASRRPVPWLWRSSVSPQGEGSA